MKGGKRRYDGKVYPSEETLMNWLREIIGYILNKFYWLKNELITAEEILHEIYPIAMKRLTTWDEGRSQWTTHLYRRITGAIKDLLYLNQSLVKRPMSAPARKAFWGGEIIKEDAMFNTQQYDALHNINDEIMIDLKMDLPVIYNKVEYGYDLTDDEKQILNKYLLGETK